MKILYFKEENEITSNPPIEPSLIVLQVDIPQPSQSPLTKPKNNTDKKDANNNGMTDEIEILMWKYAAQVLNNFFFYISVIYAAILYIWYFTRIAYLKYSI